MRKRSHRCVRLPSIKSFSPSLTSGQNLATQREAFYRRDGGKKTGIDKPALFMYYHGVRVDPVGLGVLKLAAAYRAPCKPSVQVKT